MPLLRHPRPSDQHDTTTQTSEVQELYREIIQLPECRENFLSLAVSKENISEI